MNDRHIDYGLYWPLLTVGANKATNCLCSILHCLEQDIWAKGLNSDVSLYERAGVRLDALIGVRFAHKNRWKSSNGEPVWTATIGGWTGYGIAYSRHDIAWKLLRMIGAA